MVSIFHEIRVMLRTESPRQGHAIVPAALPIGTTLYHGRRWPEPPPSPEWLALNSEFSYVFSNGTAYMHTYVTTRDLRLVYFDGSSASKLTSGAMDIVDLLIWGEFDERRVWDEYPRITALCEWGKRWGIDGYVRCVSLTYTRPDLFGRFMFFPKDANGFVGLRFQNLPCL